MEMGERQAIYQVSTLQALARGNYYGSTDMETLLTHGDTGLGTFHAVGGELIVIDGHAYRVLGDGSAVEAATSDTTPFATVTRLREQVPVRLKRQPSIEALKDILTEQVRELGINDVVHRPHRRPFPQRIGPDRTGTAGAPICLCQGAWKKMNAASTF